MSDWFCFHTFIEFQRKHIYAWWSTEQHIGRVNKSKKNKEKALV